MGKSPAKWIKSVLFGKKSSRSHASKGNDFLKAAVDKENCSGKEVCHAHVSSPVISQPVLVNTNSGVVLSEDRTPPSLVTGAVTLSINQGVQNQEIVGTHASNDSDKALEEHAATMVQAAFRGYLSRRAFRALKGIIRLQALIRGHLVRRQAVATVYCMWGIVKFQAFVRGQKARLSGSGLQVRTKFPEETNLDGRRFNFSNMQLSTNRFACKLLCAFHSFYVHNNCIPQLLCALPVARPLHIRYDPVDPNSAINWLERWSFLHFWKPLPKPKKSNVKTRVKSSGMHRNPGAKTDVTTESERYKRITRKMPGTPDPAAENPQSEIEKVKRRLRKVSNSTKETTEKPEPENLKPTCTPRKMAIHLSDVPQKSTDDSSGKSKENELVPDSMCVVDATAKSVGPKNAVIDDTESKLCTPEAISKEEITFNSNVEITVKDDQSGNIIQKSSNKRRASLSSKSEHFTENSSQNGPKLPSYMATTESAKAKLRGQVSPKFGSDSNERSNMTRRHSLPTPSNGKLSSQSPRTHKLIQASCKDGIRNDRSFSSSRDGSEKAIQVEWRR